MSALTDDEVYEKPNCTPMCRHTEVCVKCGRPHCIKSMKHSRLYGYVCVCGTSVWKPIFDIQQNTTDREPEGDDKQALDQLFRWLKKTRGGNRIVIQAAAELAALRARVAELETEKREDCDERKD